MTVVRTIGAVQPRPAFNSTSLPSSSAPCKLLNVRFGEAPLSALGRQWSSMTDRLRPAAVIRKHHFDIAPHTGRGRPGAPFNPYGFLTKLRRRQLTR